MPVYQWLAQRANESNTRGNVGLVVGATYPEELGAVRDRAPGLPILVPGIGAQGGDLERSVKAGLASDEPNLVISSSRGIVYASRSKRDFPAAAREAAASLRDRINQTLVEVDRGW
jgi:orotidine-5'-phosphate decarboxylase